MPQSQLTEPTSAICQVSATFAANAVATTSIQATIAIPIGSPTVSVATTPGQEYWYIKDVFVPQGQNVSTVNARLLTTVNITQQRISVSESESQQNSFNKTKFSPAQWIKIPPNSQWYHSLYAQNANGNANTTVTLETVIFMVPGKPMS